MYTSDLTDIIGRDKNILQLISSFPAYSATKFKERSCLLVLSIVFKSPVQFHFRMFVERKHAFFSSEDFKCYRE